MTKHFRTAIAAMFAAASLGVSPVAIAQPAIDFGDDASRWAEDGECDDPRFAGDGMSEGISLEDDIGHDATDCRVAWQAGDVALAIGEETEAPDFGDDASDWANDEECDDPRFAGPGMTGTDLLDQDIGHDATDCTAQWEAGAIWMIGDAGKDAPDFGDDDGEWSNDGECDDPRFAGAGMTSTELLQDDILHDATDCRIAWEEGEIELR